jgi:hypothetical protein
VFVIPKIFIARSSVHLVGGGSATLYQNRKKTDIVLMVTSVLPAAAAQTGPPPGKKQSKIGNPQAIEFDVLRGGPVERTTA